MPPRAKAKGKGKAAVAAVARRPAASVIRPRAAQVAESNARRDGRRAALRSLNLIAVEVGVPPLPNQVAHRASRVGEVERLVRLLDRRCSDDARGPRLRAAAQLWLANGGTLTEPLLPPPSGAAGAGDGQLRLDPHNGKPMKLCLGTAGARQVTYFTG